jgi:hypothetical protein
MIKKMAEIKHFLQDLNRESISFDRYNKNERKKFYLLSLNWVKNFLNFNDNFTSIENTDKLFEKNKVLLQYFGGEEYGGYYPGPVDNFNIMNFNEYLEDPHEKTVFLKKGIKENTDFLFVTHEEWNQIKDMFGCNFEVERSTAILSGELMIEVNLRSFKVLVLCDKFETNMLFPKSMLISKQLTVSHLKTKIKKICENLYQNGSDYKFYQMNFGLKERWRDTFELINAYAEKEKSFIVEAMTINDDSCLIEVKYFN